MRTQSICYSVVGAGHGGKAMAAHLALMGFEVTLYNRTPGHINVIKERGGITLAGAGSVVGGFGKLAAVTSSMRVALQNCDVILVVVPAYAHADIARKMAPYLRAGQIVLLNPGRTLGALEFRRVLRREGGKAGVVVAETQTFIYASRSEGPAQARIFRVKDSVALAAFPASDTLKVLKAVKPAYPQFIDGGNILQTGLNNIGGIFHPTISLLNSGRIEATRGKFQFYLDGVTPTVARIMEALDRERVEVASVLGIQAVTAVEWIKAAYNTYGENLHAAIHNQPGYRGIQAPTTLDCRYLTEDVPMSLVPIASLGRQFGISVRGTESIIRLANIAHSTDYWLSGRTVENLGIEHLTASELLDSVRKSDRPGIARSVSRFGRADQATSRASGSSGRPA